MFAQTVHATALQLAARSHLDVQPVPITIFSLTRLFPRVGLPRDLCLIGSLTAALRFSKGWVRKYLNLVIGIGCNPPLLLTNPCGVPVQPSSYPLPVPDDNGNGNVVLIAVLLVLLKVIIVIVPSRLRRWYSMIILIIMIMIIIVLYIK